MKTRKGFFAASLPLKCDRNRSVLISISRNTHLMLVQAFAHGDPVRCGSPTKRILPACHLGASQALVSLISWDSNAAWSPISTILRLSGSSGSFIAAPPLLVETSLGLQTTLASYLAYRMTPSSFMCVKPAFANSELSRNESRPANPSSRHRSSSCRTEML